MNPSYCRVRTGLDDATTRLAAWMNVPRPGRAELVSADATRAVRIATDDNGHWKGNAVFLSERGGWTILEDLSGFLSCVPPRSWLDFAGANDVVFAGYNDSIGYGELVMIERGVVVVHFLEDSQKGQRVASNPERFSRWTDVAAFVDEDDFAYSENGYVWILPRGA